MSLLPAAAVLRSNRTRTVLIVLLAAVVVLFAALTLVPPKRAVTIEEFGTNTSAKHVVRARTVADALQRLNVAVGPQDQVVPSLTSPLTSDVHIRIRRAIALTVTVDGKQQSVKATVDNVGDAVDLLGVEMGQEDRVEPPLTAPAKPGMAIAVTRVRSEVVAEEAEIPFETTQTQDHDMWAGESRVVRPGQVGKLLRKFREIFENGQLVRKESMGEEVVAEPTSRLVALGTMGVVSRGSENVRYSKEYDMIATAYAIGDGMTPGTHTAMGLPAKRGVVAVDPRVIPLGTHLYVEGYGYALAADTGGAIKGNKIDLCFDSLDEVWNFGHRNLKVYILLD